MRRALTWGLLVILAVVATVLAFLRRCHAHGDGQREGSGER